MSEPTEFDEKDLEQIRQIAIRLYVDSDSRGKDFDSFRLRVIAEATAKFLKNNKDKNET